VRHAVILRKLSYGTHSEHGSRFIERVLTVHASLRRQHRNVLAYLRDAYDAHLQGRAAPSLVPTDAITRKRAHAA
jgi:transposase